MWVDQREDQGPGLGRRIGEEGLDLPAEVLIETLLRTTGDLAPAEVLGLDVLPGVRWLPALEAELLGQPVRITA